MWKAYLSILLYLIPPVLAQAEIYKYVDESGNATFTDVYKEGAKKIDIPEEPTVRSKRKATTAEASRCLEKHRNSFRDPRSAYQVSADVVEYRMPPNDEGKTSYVTYVEVDVSARNGLGGAGRTTVQCWIK